MTELRQLMHQAIDQHHADMTGLAARARRRGTALQRRDRLTAAAASLALLGVFVVGTAGWRALFAHRGTTDAASAIGTSATASTTVTVLGSSPSRARWPHRPDGPGSPQTPQVRAIGRSVAHAVRSVSGATTSAVRSYRDEATPTSPATVEVSLRLRSEGGAPVGRFSMAFWSEASYGGTASAATTRAWLQDCGSRPDCQTYTLPDGSLVRATRTHQHLPGGTWEMAVVERDVDGVVQFVTARAPRDADNTTIASSPPLTTDQLVQVASQLDVCP
jgi:hypothetical protein